MKLFIENNCRLCKKTFCCEECRMEHEKIIHKLNPECDICIYGRAIIKTIPNEMQKHFQSAHLPLRCVNCDKTFTSITDLIEHINCPIKTKMDPKKLPITPFKAIQSDKRTDDSNYESPPINFLNIASSHICHTNDGKSSLTTSTPMQSNVERVSLDDIPEMITPVSVTESKEERRDKLKSINKNYVGLTPLVNNESNNLEQSMKRRVTFSETPDAVCSNKNFNYFPIQFNIEKKDSIDEDAGNNKYDSKFDKQDKAASASKSSESLNFPNNTMWESAVNNVDEIEIQLHTNDNEAFGCASNHQSECENAYNLNLLKSDSTFSSETIATSGNIYSDETNVVKPSTIWSSMANVVKSVMYGFSGSAVDEGGYRNSSKRLKPDEDNIIEFNVKVKKMKFSEIRCRKPIRPLIQQYARRPKKITCDRGTQTD